MNDVDKAALLKGYRRWQDVIQFVAPECSWEIGAIAFRESAWNPDAYRPEPRFYEKYIAADTPTAIEWRKRIDDHGWQRVKCATSYGLMQIMFTTAWERGYRGKRAGPDGLLVPEVSLLYGAMHFRWLWNKYTTVYNAIAAYNAGSPRRYAENEYVNQEYVDKVLAARDVLRAA